MDLISVEQKTNFFESRVSSYSLAGVGKSKEENSFNLDSDFKNFILFYLIILFYNFI